MSDPHARLAGIRLFEEALPEPLFNRLYQAVSAIGNERPKGRGTYATTFWFPRGTAPTNVAEEAIVKLFTMIKPPSNCAGAEWWLGRMEYGKKLNFHFDRDLALSRKTGEAVFPLLGSILYLNSYPSSPTIVVDQVPGPDGKSKVPSQPRLTTSIAAFSNNYAVFPGNLLHGVVPDPAVLEADKKSESRPSELRLTLLVNYWHRRPSPPICGEYDGSVYSALQDKIAA